MSSDALRTVIEDRTGEARYSWRPYMHNPVLRHWLWRVRRPTLVLWGAQDGIVGTDYGQRVASLLPQSTFHIIDGAGHYPHVEKPEVVVQHLSRFTLDEHAGRLATSPTA
jgi:pimeloyl-ACP methyl ester carboxylesterase